MSVLKKLTEGIVERSLQREGAALLEKWENTGLLEGLTNDSKKQGMARLLENQAAQLRQWPPEMSRALRPWRSRLSVVYSVDCLQMISFRFSP